MAKRPTGIAERALPMRPFSASLPMALLRSREAVMRLFRPGLRKHGVTEQQWRILRALAHSGPMEVTALAEATFLLAPSLSRILPDLEKRGLIARHFGAERTGQLLALLQELEASLAELSREGQTGLNRRRSST